MDADQVQKIFSANLAKYEDLDSASVKSCKEVSENDFAEVTRNQDIGPEKCEMVLKFIDGQSRLSYFSELPTEGIIITDMELYKHMMFLMRVWGDAVRYVYNSHHLLREEFQKKNEKKNLKKLADSISFRIEKRATDLIEVGAVFFSYQEWQEMAHGFAFAIRLVLGDEIFMKFREATNKSFAELRRLCLCLESITSKTSSIN